MADRRVTTRTIDAPAADWLTEDEAVTYLGLPYATFRRLLDAGAIPGARVVSRQREMRFHWRGLVALSWLIELGHLDPTQAAEENRGKPAKTSDS